MPSARPQATVVVVTYNGAHLLPDCLDALAKQTLPSDQFEVWVVDNGSIDATGELVAGKYPWAQLLRASENLGFAGGNNLALRLATTPFAVVVNNDARPEPDFLERVLAPFAEPGADRVAAVTAKVHLDERREGHDVINSTGNLIARSGWGFDRDFLRVDDGAPADREVFGFCGCAAALRMSALREVDFFDDDLFLYFEDTDLSWRLRATGWEIWHEPTAVARHLYAASSDPGSPFSTYQQGRNMLLVFTRHAPVRVAAWVAVRFLLSIPWHAVREAPNLRLTIARLKAVGGFVRRLPRALVDRRRIWRDAPVPRDVVARFIVTAPPRPRVTPIASPSNSRQ
ncbi:MAG: glycosyltransferase family 2 protein [Acidimicrobiales bacterium]